MLKSLTIDLNCDMGEGMPTDADIFPFISSANIACGFHAGNADTMRRTVESAMRNHVAIGAHPSYPDREGFGRKDMLGNGISLEEIPCLIVNQLIALQAICEEFGTTLHHVKPHGALYNRAAADPRLSTMICRAIREFDASLYLYGLSGSHMRAAAASHGLRFISEVFADRTYRADGSLTPRSQPNALITDESISISQVLRMVEKNTVLVTPAAGPDPSSAAAEVPASPQEILLRAETICLHGDGDHAVAFARLIHQTLSEKGIGIEAPGTKSAQAL